MKNKLLALMALCGATSSTMPLWASENWPDPVLSFTDPNLTQDETGGGVYYIYHVATQKFMVNGNYKETWGTELVVGDEGQEVTLSYGEDYELARRPEGDPDRTTAKGWRLSMMNAPSNGGYHELFIREASMVICVDHNKTGHILWKIVPQGNSMYRIKILDEDTKFGVNANGGLYKNAYMGVNEGETGVNPVLDTNMAGFENGQQDWKFVSPEAYNVYKAKKKLQEQLDAADVAGFDKIADYAAIYNSTEATAEEVEQAVEGLKAAILDFKYSSATADKPITVTELISQPSFDENTEGWVTTKDAVPSGVQDNFTRKPNDKLIASDGKECVNFFERWIPSSAGNQPNWSITQELKNLPDGKYRLGAYIMTNVLAQGDVTGPKGRFLMAKTLAGEVRKEADVPAIEDPNHSNGYFVPYTLEFSVIGGTATIGMVVENANSNWTAVDNFTLEYLGKADALTVRDMLEQNIKDAEAKYAEYTGANERFSLSGQQKYEETIKAAKDAVANEQLDDEALMGLITTVQLRMDSLAMDISAYKTLAQKSAELEDAYAGTEYEEAGLLLYEDYLDQLAEGLAQRTFNPNEVDSIQPRADRILKQAVLESLQSEDGLRTVTGLFTNMDFSNGMNGWTKEGSGDFKHSSTGVCELWNARQTDGEVYQEISNLPSGSYKITMQGYYSPSSSNANSWQQNWGMEGDQTNDILGYLKANDASAKLHHIMDYPLTEDEKGTADRYEQITFTDDPQYKDKWLVRSVAAAAETFGNFPDRYVNEVVCYVGEDGKLRVGIKAAMASHDWLGAWIVMDNFKVEYLGADDMTGATTSINALIATATDMMNKEGVLTTQEAKEGLNAAIESANKAVSEGLTLEVYNEQVEVLNAAIKAGQEAIDAATALEKRNDNHNDKLTSTGEESYDAYVDTDGFAELEEVVLEIEGKISGEGIFASMAEIEDYNAKLDKAYTKMVSGIIDFSAATKDAPVDATGLIINPSFQTRNYDEKTGTWKDASSADGWTATGGTATSGLNYEIFNDTTGIRQKLYNMPAGYYRVVYNGFYRAGDITPAALSRRDGVEPLNAQVYLDGKESKWNKKLVSLFENISEYKYTTGDKIVPDTLLTPEEEGMLYHFIINGVDGAKTVFEEGIYEDNFSFRVEVGEEPVLGVRKTAKIQNDWTCFDNFRLYYLGDGDANKPDDIDDALDTNIDEVVTDGKAIVVSSAWYTINGVRVAEPKQRGIYIRQDKMSDGTTKSVKVMVR